LIQLGSKESSERVVSSKAAWDLALDMKRRNLIDIIERFQTEHALKNARKEKFAPVAQRDGQFRPNGTD
jgi:hypothetical protein